MHVVVFVFAVLLKAQDPLGNDISGDNQIGDVNSIVKKPFVVRVLSDSAKPLRNADVEFSIVQEPVENRLRNRTASLDMMHAQTDLDGYAMVRLTLGSTRGVYCVAARYGGEVLILKTTALEKNWVLFLLIAIAGGLALFIFGLNYGSKGLIREAGAKMRDLLFSLTTNRLSGLGTGIAAAVILGSGSAAAVLLVRFASTGIIGLPQALGVLLGADIGSTIVVQVLAFNILDYALLIVAAGVFLRVLFPSMRNAAQFVLGIGLLFFSLRIMSQAAGDLKYVPGIGSVLNAAGNYPVIGIVVGAILAFVFHSSAAIIGMVLILAFESLIELQAALPLVLGANLGTTFSTVFAADTVSGRRVASGQLLFRLAGIILLLPVLGPIAGFISGLGGDVARQVANFHTFFNVLVALIFTPLLTPFERLLRSTIRENKKDLLRIKKLDPAFLAAPAIAMGQAVREIMSMADIIIRMVDSSMTVIRKKDITLRKRILEMDDEADQIASTVTPYLSHLSHEEMDEKLARLQKGMLCIVNELEHIGDVVSKNLMTHAKKQIDNGMVFSEKGLSDIVEFHDYVIGTLRIAVSGMATRDPGLAREAAARREMGLGMAKEYEARHLSRLAQGLKETIETSTIHLDIISDLERINFHASEIGEAVQ